MEEASGKRSYKPADKENFQGESQFLSEGEPSRGIGQKEIYGLGTAISHSIRRSKRTAEGSRAVEGGSEKKNL